MREHSHKREFADRPISILLVDEEPLVLRTLAVALAIDGHSIRMARGGEAGLALFRPGEFQLVIVDSSLKAPDGEDLAVAIKRRAPDQAVLVLSAGAEYIAGKPVGGADLVLPKPLSITLLRVAVQKLAPAPGRMEEDLPQ